MPWQLTVALSDHMPGGSQRQGSAAESRGEVMHTVSVRILGPWVRRRRKVQTRVRLRRGSTYGSTDTPHSGQWQQIWRIACKMKQAPMAKACWQVSAICLSSGMHNSGREVDVGCLVAAPDGDATRRLWRAVRQDFEANKAHEQLGSAVSIRRSVTTTTLRPISMES